MFFLHKFFKYVFSTFEQSKSTINRFQNSILKVDKLKTEVQKNEIYIMKTIYAKDGSFQKINFKISFKPFDKSEIIVSKIFR